MVILRYKLVDYAWKLALRGQRKRSKLRSFLLEERMAKVNLSRMDVKSLLDLRDQVDQRLREHRVELQK